MRVEFFARNVRGFCRCARHGDGRNADNLHGNACFYVAVVCRRRGDGDGALLKAFDGAVCDGCHGIVGRRPQNVCRGRGRRYGYGQCCAFADGNGGFGFAEGDAFDVGAFIVAVGVDDGLKSGVVAFAVVAINPGSVFRVIDERVAVALNFVNFFVSSVFFFRRRFFEVPLHKGGNAAYGFVVALAVDEFEAIFRAPSCLNVHQNPCGCAAVAFARIKRSVCQIAKVAVGSGAVFFDYVGRKLRDFVKAVTASGGIQVGVARPEVVSVGTCFGRCRKSLAAVFRPDVFAVRSAVEIAGKRNRRAGVEPDYVSAFVRIFVGRFKNALKTVVRGFAGVSIFEYLRKFCAESRPLRSFVFQRRVITGRGFRRKGAVRGL